MLKVSRQPDGTPEIFASLQGEGAALGTPSVFLRLATCNLACTWCDTRYTWDWANHDYFTEVMEMSWQEVREKIVSLNCPHLVITGGEPLLQQQELAPLIGDLAQAGYTFEVETNGTISPTSSLTLQVHQWNVSPKLANSGNPLGRRQVDPTLRAFGALPNAYFKFVVEQPGDLEEVEALVGSYQLARDRVILMPEGRDPDTLRQRSLWLSQLCVRAGFRFSPRLHILLWGDKRGT